MPPAGKPALLHSFEIQIMLKALQAQGVDRARVLAGSDVTPRELENPTHRLTLQQELALYRAIARFNRNPLLALNTGSRLGLSNYGVLGYAMIGYDSVAAALQLLVDFMPLVSWAARGQLKPVSCPADSPGQASLALKVQPCLALEVQPTPTDAATCHLPAGN